MTGLEFDPTQIPAILSLLFTGATFGGVVKVVRWTADHDSRMAAVEKDFTKHVADDEKIHTASEASHKDLVDKMDWRTQRLTAVERDIAYLAQSPANFPASSYQGPSAGESGPLSPPLHRHKPKG